MEKAKHYVVLDGLRGVAACVVALGHMQYSAFRRPTFFHENLAVSFFFILSGFVLARAYEDRLRSGMPVRDFVMLRIIRLFPLIALGICLGAMLLHPPHLLAKVVLGCLLIPISANVFFPLDGPLWSLLYEFWANVLYAAIARYRWITVALAVTGAAILIHVTARGRYLNGGFTVGTVEIGLGEILWGFFGGVLLKWLLTAKRIARLPAVPFPLLVLVFLAFLHRVPGEGTWYDALCVFLAFPVLVALGTKDAVAGRMRKLAVFSGALSYPLYVLHAPFSGLLREYNTISPIVFIGLFLAVVGLSYAAGRWYDEPVRKWLGSMTKRGPAVPRAVTARD